MADKPSKDIQEPDASLEDTRPSRAVQLQKNMETGGHGPSTTEERKRDVGTHSPKGDPDREQLHGPLHEDEDRSGTHADQ